MNIQSGPKSVYIRYILLTLPEAYIYSPHIFTDPYKYYCSYFVFCERQHMACKLHIASQAITYEKFYAQVYLEINYI